MPSLLARRNGKTYVPVEIGLPSRSDLIGAKWILQVKFDDNDESLPNPPKAGIAAAVQAVATR